LWSDGTLQANEFATDLYTFMLHIPFSKRVLGSMVGGCCVENVFVWKRGITFLCTKQSQRKEHKSMTCQSSSQYMIQAVSHQEHDDMAYRYGM
jgi:hypothetical protein